MKSLKMSTGKVPLKGSSIIKAAAFSLGCVIVMIAAMILKIMFLSGAESEKRLSVFVILTVGLIALMSVFFVYVLNSRTTLIMSLKKYESIVSIIVLCYIVNIYASVIDTMAMPICMAAFVIAPIAKRRDAFISNLFTTIMVAFTLIVELKAGGDITLYGIIIMMITGFTVGSIASYIVTGSYKRVSYIIKSVILGTLSMAILSLYTILMPEGSFDHTTVVYIMIGSYSPLFFGLLLQPIVESVFNLITNSKLVELTDYNSPLIKRLRLETPGTFNHSQAVAVFAEVCASAIGENPYLARACAYYHDVGKLEAAQYFKENQGEKNPHDDLLPEVSADIIRSHTTEGQKLCDKYRIPYEVSHVTIQHHGNMLIPLFYKKAQQLTDGHVDTYEYSYHAQTPVTKVAAIIMLCDVSEAAIRSMVSPDGEKVDKLLSGLIAERIAAGQFDNCDISLRDLDTIKRTIIASYGGLFHKRIAYDDDKKRKRHND